MDHGRHGFDVHGLWDVWVWRGSEFWLWVVVVWWCGCVGLGCDVGCVGQNVIV